MTQSTVNLTAWDSIEDDLFSVFRAMSQTQGYNFNWGRDAVVGWMGGGFPFRKRNPVMGIAPGPEECDDTFGVAMRRCIRDVGIEAWADVDKRKSTHAASRTYQMLISDIEKALMGSVASTAHTRGGYAEDTEIIERQPVTSGNPREVGAFVRIRIIYRHQVGDLYTKL